MKLSLYDYSEGLSTPPGLHAVYDFENDKAFFGEALVEGRGLVWRLEGDGIGAKMSAEIELDRDLQWIMRCDRVDLPPGAIAYKHCHPGLGIRFILFGGITIETRGEANTYGRSDAWFEPGPEPVYATASETEPTAFVRVMLLPREWEGKRTIRYLNPEDLEKPKLQVARIYFDQPIALPPA